MKRKKISLNILAGLPEKQTNVQFVAFEVLLTCPNWTLI